VGKGKGTERRRFMDEIMLKLDHTEKTVRTELSDEELASARLFAEKIDLQNRTMVLQYGIEAQRRVYRLSESAHLAIPESDLNEVESLLKKLLSQLNAFEKEVLSRKNPGLVGKEAFQRFHSLYDRFNSRMSECARRLDLLRSSLLRHIERLEGYSDSYLNIIREFDLYLYAGEVCLAENRSDIQPRLLENAQKSGRMEDQIILKNAAEDLQMFEKKLSDLSISRQLPVQIIAELRLIQGTDTVMAENLRRLILNIFPLYRHAIVIAMEQSGEQAVDPKQIKAADDTLRDAIQTVLKEENEKRLSQKEYADAFHQSLKGSPGSAI